MKSSDRVSRTKGETIHVTARVPVALAARFAEIAEADYRSVSAELRRLMEQRVAEADKDKQEVAA